MCVANLALTSDGRVNYCAEAGEYHFCGYCGWCWANMLSKFQRRCLKHDAGLRTSTTIRYQPGVSPWLAVTGVGLSFLAGFGTAALFWWRHV